MYVIILLNPINTTNPQFEIPQDIETRGCYQEQDVEYHNNNNKND